MTGKNMDNDHLIQEAIHSDDPARIKQVVNDLDENTLNKWFEEIAEVIFETTNPEVEELIFQFIVNQKNPVFAHPLARLLIKYSEHPRSGVLLSAMWQSRIDFSEELIAVVEASIRLNSFAAVEAMTIIENSMSSVNEEQKNQALTEIQGAIEQSTYDKRVILQEMQQVISQI